MTETVENFINGEWCEASTGERFASRNPADARQLVAEAPLSDREDVDRAVAAARAALPAWSRLPAPRRGEILFRAGEMLVRNKRRLGDLVTREMGKVLAEGLGDVQEAIDIAFYMAGEGRRKVLFQQLRPGEMVSGTVTNVTEFGVFVDLGGVEGLIHVSELSWGRVQHPANVLQIGQKVQTQVLSITEESSRVALSLKRLYANPWETLIKRYKPGDVVPASITTIMRYGAFAKLEEGVEGLIHISSINLPPGEKDLESILHTGQNVQVRILHIEVERRRLGLGLVTVE